MPAAPSVLGRATATRRVRRGSVYVLVLGTALIVTVLGLSAVVIARVQLRGSEQAVQADEAAVLALAAAERAVAIVSSDPTWRDKHAHGDETGGLDLGGGTISYRLLDLGADTDLQTSESIRVEGIGRAGDAVRVHSVEMSGEAPLSCLSAALHAGGNILANGWQLDCDQIISTNGTCEALSAEITGEVEARGDIIGSTYFGPTRAFGEGRAMPDPATVFDYYLANGTHIASADLTWSGGHYKILETVLSPKSNPYGGGAINPEGIYVVDTSGTSLSIVDSRIVGTLVVLNAPEVRTRGHVHLSPAVPGYPVLLVDGPLAIEHDSTTPLDEAALGINFNPPGAPYRGEVDADTDDLLESVVEGLVYGSGSVVQNTGDSRLVGVVVIDGDFAFSSNRFELRYDAEYVRKPPPGFQTAPGPLAVVPGSWRWEVAP